LHGGVFYSPDFAILWRMKKTIAIDMDGVLADFETQLIIWYEKDYGIKVTRESFIGLPESEALPHKGAVLDFILTPGFFRTLTVIEGAVDAVIKLMEHYEVYIVSAAMEFPLSLNEKYDWLQEHFPFITWRNIIFCGDKSIVNTDYMIDDHPKNLDHFKGKTIMFSAGHNANFSHHERVNNWNEVLAFFEAVAD
jgi:5'(3')-deoxyribonucleotidase